MQTLESILRVPSPYIRRNAAGGAWCILILSVQEGVLCRFAASTWNDRILAAITTDLIRDIGWKTVEHARRRQVVIRCASPAQAEIDCGLGFVPLPIQNSDEEPLS